MKIRVRPHVSYEGSLGFMLEQRRWFIWHAIQFFCNEQSAQAARLHLQQPVKEYK